MSDLREFLAKYEVLAKGAAIALLAIFCSSPLRVTRAIFSLVWTSIGVSIGIAFGLGFAMHVYEQLQSWTKAHEKQKRFGSQISPQAHSSILKHTSSALEDGSSYFAMMALAGYPRENKVLKGQVLKKDSPFWDVKYPFTDVKVDVQIGPNMLRKDWPGLPEPVTVQLGRFIEHVMRDFVSIWYSKFDKGCQFIDEREKRDLGIQRDGKKRVDATNSVDTDPGDTSLAEEIEGSNLPSSARRQMVYTTAAHRNIPFLDQTYRVLSVAFGSIATRAEHMNIFSLALLKWTKVLSHTLKQYRFLRKAAQEKSGKDSASEVEIIREFLLAGKLHKAVTFGLDVPSLLFADANGTELGTNHNGETNRIELPRDATTVLEERLFGSPDLLKECELDYNRCLAFRLIQALLPKTESSSCVVSALVTEIVGACVLQPIMNLWTPSFLNEIIVSVAKKEEVNNDASLDQNLMTVDDGKVSVDSTEDKNYVMPSSNSAESEEEKSSDALSILSPNAHKQALIQTPTNNIEVDNCKAIDENDEEILASRVLVLLSSAIADLRTLIDFELLKSADLDDRDKAVKFEQCQMSIARIVLLVEYILLHGRCRHRISVDKNYPTLREDFHQILMDLTSDMDAFEKKILALEEMSVDFIAEEHAQVREEFDMQESESATLRTLIATWLRSGTLPRALYLITRSMKTILRPHYIDDALLLDQKAVLTLLEIVQIFEAVDIQVEVTTLLCRPVIDIEVEARPNPNAGTTSETTLETGSMPSGAASEVLSHSLFESSAIPRFIDFHKNSAFASSLRMERERRLQSWERQKGDANLTSVHRTYASESDMELHKEMHSLARFFYNRTCMISVRDAARRSDSDTDGDTSSREAIMADKVSLITVESVSNRRRIEIPDDDSSFLLRAQSRQVNPVSVHRDDRNHDLSYKCFLATYEEPVAPSTLTRQYPGKAVRRVWIQYYPIDRTATVLLNNDIHTRKVDRRKGALVSQGYITSNRDFNPHLSGAFLRGRHLCKKQNRSGTQSFLSSSVVESADFVATPRHGRAIDFVYRLSLFEQPIIDLAGKHFTVQDSTTRGHHRADASSLEVSDASLSFLLLHCSIAEASHEDGGTVPAKKAFTKQKIESGPDGYPILFMKLTNKDQGESKTEIKPYRMSFVRAALLVTSARHEAQQQCLIDCINAGSPKSATKARTDARLQPVLKILEFANDCTIERLKESVLLRDLKLGVNHIDQHQLRRNGLLSPRYPTKIVNLDATVEGSVQARDVPELFGSTISQLGLQPTSVLYKIKCSMTVNIEEVVEEATDIESYIGSDGALGSQYIEEWIVFRSMKDFQALHKHLKTQVANTESSASAGSRLVGAATAAFSNTLQGRRNRKPLIPSMSQANKTGSLAVTQWTIMRRGELLEEYLKYELAERSIINRSSELLLFLGASFPFPGEIRVSNVPIRLAGDPLGRTEFFRRLEHLGTQPPFVKQSINASLRGERSSMLAIDEAMKRSSALSDSESILFDSISNKVDAVPLSEIRNRLVELVKFQFGFENASFFRSRLLAALETASFVAMTKGSEFRKLLYRTHIERFSPEAIASMIEKVLDVLWPDGCWMKPRPTLSTEEEDALRQASCQQLHEVFPEQIRTILGGDLTRDGLNVLHEMLQNRLVVKSLFYMCLDLLWIEIFPELRDALPCASALDID